MASFLNTLLLTLSAFALLFLWFYYYTKLVWVSCLCAFLLSFALCLITYSLQKANRKRHGKKYSAKEIEKLKSHLALSCDGKKTVCEILKKQDYTVKNALSGLLAVKYEKRFYVYVSFCTHNLTEQQTAVAVKLCKRYGLDNLMIFCRGYSTSCAQIAKNCGISTVFFDAASVYDALKKQDGLPDLSTVNDTKKANKLFAVALCKERSAVYLAAAVSLIFFSAISLFPVYTLSFATIQLSLAVYSKYNKRFNVSAD